MFFPAQPGNYGCIIKLFVVLDTGDITQSRTRDMEDKLNFSSNPTRWQ